MALLGRLLIDIVANTSQLKTDLEGARKELGAFRGNVEGALGSVGKFGSALLKLGGGTLALSGIIKLAKDSTISFAEAERQSLRLDAVIRATGNSAGISSKELKAMANELARSSLFDDQSILTAISQLETFDNVSGKTFKNAIRLSVDLASLWDGDVSSAAFALGKALQSPADAAALLGRAKVRLTEEEKKAIEEFSRMNNIAAAQEVILKALQDRVGGVAGDEASGLAGSYHRLTIKIDEARKSMIGWFLSLGSGPGLGEVIENAFKNGAGLNGPKGPLPPLKLNDLDTFTSTANISSEIGGLSSLVGLDPKRVTDSDIRRLRELGAAHAGALKLGNLEIETRVRLVRELKSIQDALAALGLDDNNLGAPRDLSRMGASPEEEAKLREVIGTSKLSSAMTGVGGERGLSPFGEAKVEAAAALWRETWVNAIKGTQEAFADFFMSIGQEGFKLVNVFKDVGRAIQSTVAQMLSGQVVNAIFGAAFGGISGPGGANRGNITQSGVGPSSARAPTVVHVHQANTLRVDAVDGPSVQRMLDTHGHLFLGKIAEGVGDAPDLARYIVAVGSQ